MKLPLLLKIQGWSKFKLMSKMKLIKKTISLKKNNMFHIISNNDTTSMKRRFQTIISVQIDVVETVKTTENKNLAQDFSLSLSFYFILQIKH